MAAEPSAPPEFIVTGNSVRTVIVRSSTGQPYLDDVPWLLARRICECLNACAGLADPAAVVESARQDGYRRGYEDAGMTDQTSELAVLRKELDRLRKERGRMSWRERLWQLVRDFGDAGIASKGCGGRLDSLADEIEAAEQVVEPATRLANSLLTWGNDGTAYSEPLQDLIKALAAYRCAREPR